MCVGYWSLEHPEYSLVLCANRDEFLDRPTVPAHFHDFGPLDSGPTGQNVLSGRDRVAGGTWLGVARTGRVALLTNITEPYAIFSTSRGHLLQDFLQPQTRDALGLPEAVNRLTGRNSEPYAGFNMLLLDPTVSVTTGSIDYVGAFVTNHGGGGVITSRPLSSPECQCGALSNGIDGRDAGAWPKVQVGLAALDAVMHRGKMDEKDLVEELFNLLRWKSSEPPETRAQLRNTIMIDPLALAPKPHAASTEPRYYGTRLSTVVLVPRETNRVTFIERDIWGLGGDGKPVMGEVHQQREFRFDAQLGVGTS